MRFIPLQTADQVFAAAVRLIISRINKAAENNEVIVLGLSVGHTMARIYHLLIEAYEGGYVDFSNVVTFNIDEYVGLNPDHPELARNFMFSNLFNYVNCPPENIHILDGQADDHVLECEAFERKIEQFGGIDLIIGPMGADGHIAYNEPYSSLTSRTRHKHLDLQTIEDRKKYFNNDIEKTPTEALTFGVGTILDSKELLVVGTGVTKALTIHHAVEGNINHMASAAACCQMHKFCTILVDGPAVGELKVKTFRYFKMVHHAVIDAFVNITRASSIDQIMSVGMKKNTQGKQTPSDEQELLPLKL